MTKNNNKTLLFCIVTSIFWFSCYTYVPILSPYTKSLGASYKMIGLIIGSYGFVQMLLKIPLGIISDKMDKRKIFFIAGFALSIISNLGMWYFKVPISLLIFRALSGVACATWVIQAVLFTSYFDVQDTSKAIGILNSFNFLGQVSGTFFGGIVAQYYGQKYTFLLASIAGIIGIFLSLGIYEERTHIERTPVKLSDILEISRDSNLILVSSLAFALQIILFSAAYGFAPVAAKNIGASNFQLGILATLTSLPAIVASTLSGTFFTKRFGEKLTIAVGFILFSLSSLLIPVISNIYVFFIIQIIGGFGRGLAHPLLMALSIRNVKPRKRATAMGFFQAIYALGMFLGPVMVGYLSDNVGLNWGFIAAGLIGVAASFVSAVFIKNTAQIS